VQRNGSDQVASYIASPSFGEGSIGYDEYAYALNNNIPVVKVLNKAGYYSLPTPSNVAIALTKAVIDNNEASPTYLMQNLDQVYTNPDPRTYPLSSYSYLIVPRAHREINGNNAGPPPRFDSSKGATLSTWLNYVLCGAQQKAGALGYSPLPKNLVVGGFQQVDNIPGHVATPDTQQLTGCNNPTYSNGHNYLVDDAPQPNPCDKVGQPLTCGTAAPPTTTQTTAAGGPTSTGPAQGPTGRKTRGKSVSSAPLGTLPSPSASTSTDPETGLGAPTAGSTDGTLPGAVPVALQTPSSSKNWLLPLLTALDIIAAIALPGIVLTWLRRRRASNE
jgi:hypothetical protein